MSDLIEKMRTIVERHDSLSQTREELRTATSVHLTILQSGGSTICSVVLDDSTRAALLQRYSEPLENTQKEAQAMCGHRLDVSPEDVRWVVNSIGELGVKVGGRFFFLYKGYSLEYGVEMPAADPSEPPLMWTEVGKREFGETVSTVVNVQDGRHWMRLPFAGARK